MAGKVEKGLAESQVAVGEWGGVRVSPLFSVFSFFFLLSLCSSIREPVHRLVGGWSM